jgi:nitrite reductase/ring-hydroxylating ferredoxin subunit
MTQIVCPLHLRAFSFSDGQCAEGEVIKVHTATVEAGQIVLDL